MRRVIFAILFSLIYSLCAAQEKDSTYFEGVFTIVEEMPYFGICDSNDTHDCFKDNFFAFVENNLIFPSIKNEVYSKIRVYVKFVVNKNGYLDTVYLARSSGIKAYDDEALKVVKKLPKFTPGMQKGKAVNVQFLVPIDFKFEQEVFTIVEEMPVFGNCDSLAEEDPYKGYYRQDKKQTCSTKNIRMYIEEQVALSPIKVEDKTKVFIKFVIDTIGKTRQISVLRTSLNKKIDDEAVRIIQEMPKWTPGTQRGRKVPVQYVLPISF